jgi:hypothetical protein
MKTFELNKDWRVDLDEANPSGVRIYRQDGKFFEVCFSTLGWGQPIIREKGDSTGVTGEVIAFVRCRDGVWQVAVRQAKRPCDDFTNVQVEGFRASKSNSTALPAITVPVEPLAGYNHCNSARIVDKTLFAIADWTDHPDVSVPDTTWVSFKEFFRTSTDIMTKALLGQFMVERLGLA